VDGTPEGLADQWNRGRGFGCVQSHPTFQSQHPLAIYWMFEKDPDERGNTDPQTELFCFANVYTQIVTIAWRQNQ